MEEMSVEGNSNIESSPTTIFHDNTGESEINGDILPAKSLDNPLKHENGDNNAVDGILASNASRVLEAEEEDVCSFVKFGEAAQSLDNSLKLENSDSIGAEEGNDCSIVKSGDAGQSETNMDITSAQSLDNSLKLDNGDKKENVCSIVKSDVATVNHMEIPTLLRHKRTFSAEPNQLRVKPAVAMHKRTLSHEHVIDTAAPIESVKEAVSKFGGIVDWKAHKMRNEEKRKKMEVELRKVQEEMFKYKEQLEAAKDEKEKVLSELDIKKGAIKDLKLDLERAEYEELQAKQDAELARLRVKEVQQGIGNAVSAAIHAELEVAHARLSAAVAELKSVKDELEKLSSEYSSLLIEKEEAVRRAEEAASASMEAEKTVEALIHELNTVKGSLESAHAAHLEAEEQRLREDISKIQDTSNWERELKEAEDKLKLLDREHQSQKAIKLKLEEATSLLLTLKAELEAYKVRRSEKKQEDNNESASSEKLASLEEMRAKIEKATTEVNYLKVASASLDSELEKEKLASSLIKTREGMASVTVSSLEYDLSNIMSELESVKVDMPQKISKAKQEIERNKSLALSSNAEMMKAKQEEEVVKAIAFTIDRRLHAAQLEIEAARASERLALAAVKALEESENSDENAQKGVTLSLEEYQALSKKAYTMEERASEKLVALIAQVEEAKKSELRSLERLEEMKGEKTAKGEELKIAIEKAEKAREEKLDVEQALRKWRTENEKRRRSSDVGPTTSDLIRSSTSSLGESKIFEPGNMEDIKRFERSSTAPVQADVDDLMHAMESDSSSETEVLKKKKKKKSLFPRIVMFLARRKVQSSRVI